MPPRFRVTVLLGLLLAVAACGPRADGGAGDTVLEPVHDLLQLREGATADGALPSSCAIDDEIRQKEADLQPLLPALEQTLFSGGA